MWYCAPPTRSETPTSGPAGNASAISPAVKSSSLLQPITGAVPAHDVKITIRCPHPVTRAATLRPGATLPFVSTGGHITGCARVLKAGDVPFYKEQVKVVLRNCGEIDPTRIESFIERDGYAVIEAASGREVEALEAYRKATMLAPKDAEVLRAHAHLLARRGSARSTPSAGLP